jgi:hypothetical protein
MLAQFGRHGETKTIAGCKATPHLVLDSPQEYGPMSPAGYLALLVFPVCLGAAVAASSREESERIIRAMVNQAINRLNQGDVTAFDDSWDQNADYVSVDGRLIQGRRQIQEFTARW